MWRYSRGQGKISIFLLRTDPSSPDFPEQTLSQVLFGLASCQSTWPGLRFPKYTTTAAGPVAKAWPKARDPGAATCTSRGGRQGAPGSLFSLLARVGAGGLQSACSGAVRGPAGERWSSLWLLCTEVGRASACGEAGRREARGCPAEHRGSAAGRGRCSRAPRGAQRRPCVKLAARRRGAIARAQDLRSGWPARPRLALAGAAQPLRRRASVASPPRGGPAGGRFKRPERGGPNARGRGDLPSRGAPSHAPRRLRWPPGIRCVSDAGRDLVPPSFGESSLQSGEGGRGAGLCPREVCFWRSRVGGEGPPQLQKPQRQQAPSWLLTSPGRRGVPSTPCPLSVSINCLLAVP